MPFYVYRDKCKNFNQKDFNVDECDTIGFKLLSLKQREITEQNLEELVFRFMFLQKLMGSTFKYDKILNAQETRDMFRRYMGLQTNAEKETRNSFIRSWTRVFAEDIAYDIRKEAEA